MAQPPQPNGWSQEDFPCCAHLEEGTFETMVTSFIAWLNRTYPHELPKQVSVPIAEMLCDAKQGACIPPQTVLKLVEGITHTMFVIFHAGVTFGVQSRDHADELCSGITEKEKTNGDETGV